MTTKLDYKTLARDAKSTNKDKNEAATMVIIVLFFSIFLVVGVMAQIPRPTEQRPQPQISAISSQSK